MSEPSSHITLEKIRNTYSIPETVHLRWAKSENDTNTPEEICIFYGQFMAGLRFPLHPLIRELLCSYDVAPGQMNGNFYRIMNTIIRLNEHEGMSITVDHIISRYRLKLCPSSTYYYYLAVRPKKNPIINGLPDSDKTWFKHPIIVSGAWEFSPNDNGHVVPRTFNLTAPPNIKPPHLSKQAEEALSAVWLLPFEKRRIGYENVLRSTYKDIPVGVPIGFQVPHRSPSLTSSSSHHSAIPSSSFSPDNNIKVEASSLCLRPLEPSDSPPEGVTLGKRHHKSDLGSSHSLKRLARGPVFEGPTPLAANPPIRPSIEDVGTGSTNATPFWKPSFIYNEQHLTTTDSALLDNKHALSLMLNARLPQDIGMVAKLDDEHLIANAATGLVQAQLHTMELFTRYVRVRDEHEKTMKHATEKIAEAQRSAAEAMKAKEESDKELAVLKTRLEVNEKKLAKKEEQFNTLHTKLDKKYKAEVTLKLENMKDNFQRQLDELMKADRAATWEKARRYYCPSSEGSDMSSPQAPLPTSPVLVEDDVDEPALRAAEVVCPIDTASDCPDGA